MNEPHRIRLRGPWQRRVIDEPSVPDTSIKMPSGWSPDLGNDFQGVVEYQRYFNLPTGLDDTSQLRLVFDQIIGAPKISLNEQQLFASDTSTEAISLDVTDKLESRNDLRVQIHALSIGDGGLVGEVRLEIS